MRVDYTSTEGVEGVMLYARPGEACPVMTLPLNLEGPHHLFIGIHYSNNPYPRWNNEGCISVKLSGDPGFRRVAPELGTVLDNGKAKFPDGQDLFKSIQEAYWRTTDLTDQELLFRQAHAPYNDSRKASLANIAWIRAVPLTSEEWEAFEAVSKPRAATRRLAAIYCPGHLSGSTDGTPIFHPTNEEWFVDDFEAYRNSDIDLFIFEAMRGNFCLFPTRFGCTSLPGAPWNPTWADPLGAFSRQARANDMKIHAAIRFIGPQYPVIQEPISLAQLAYYRPMERFAKRDREGNPLATLSIAYPEVRAHWLRLMREALEYDIDGLTLILNRSTPFIQYEEKVVQDFLDQYGEDPRNLPESDMRWVRHTAGYLTAFVEEIRALVDEKPGRELGVIVYGPNRETPGDPYYKLKSYVCDVDEWLRRRLVDIVIPSQQIDDEALQNWSKLAAPGVRLWPDLMPRQQTPAQFTRLARHYQENGANGFAFWDSERRNPRLSEWAGIRRLGHMEDWNVLARESTDWYRTIRLKTLGGFSADNSFRDG